MAVYIPKITITVELNNETTGNVTEFVSDFLFDDVQGSRVRRYISDEFQIDPATQAPRTYRQAVDAFCEDMMLVSTRAALRKIRAHVAEEAAASEEKIEYTRE